MSSSFIKTAALLLLATAAALPARAQKVYLFAGDRAQNGGRSGSIHRYLFDAASPSAGIAAPGTLEGATESGTALWGGAADGPNKGLDISGLALGPEGDIYAVSGSARKVFRIDGATGAIKAEVLSGLTAPDGLTMGPDGHLYISDGDTIRRCSRDGKPLPGAEQIGNVFTRGGNLATASGLTFGPDGNLYVASQNWHRILRYDGKTGEFLDIFNYGDVSNPTGLTFGPDGNLYVACVGGPGFNAESGSVVKLHGKSGEFISRFAPEAKGALSAAFAPDGSLLVSHYWTGRIERYDGVSGARLGVWAANPAGSAFYSLLFARESTAPGRPLQPLTPAKTISRP